MTLFTGIDSDSGMLVCFVLIIVVTALLSILWIRGKPPLARAVVNVRLSLLSLGLFLVILCMQVPPTAALGSYGYPDRIADIESPAKLLVLLQDYNRTLVRVTDTLRYSLIVFAAWFLGLVFNLAQLGQLAARSDTSVSSPKPSKQE
jgi:hypothetical protein